MALRLQTFEPLHENWIPRASSLTSCSAALCTEIPEKDDQLKCRGGWARPLATMLTSPTPPCEPKERSEEEQSATKGAEPKRKELGFGCSCYSIRMACALGILVCLPG